MFHAYCGYMGGGKTLGMVRYIENYKEEGDIIITNFYYKNSDFVLHDFQEFMDMLLEIIYLSWKNKGPILGKEKKIIIAMDEGAVWFDARSFASLPEVVRAFLPQMRKLNVEAMYAVQVPKMIDNVFRKYTEKYIEHINLLSLCFIQNEYELDPDDPNFRRVKYADNADTKSSGRKLNSIPIMNWRWNQSKYFKLFDTYEIITKEKMDFEKLGKELEGGKLASLLGDRRSAAVAEEQRQKKEALEKGLKNGKTSFLSSLSHKIDPPTLQNLKKMLPKANP
jgi:hypothetical protein